MASIKLNATLETTHLWLSTWLVAAWIIIHQCSSGGVLLVNALQVGFYSTRCPDAESTVKAAVNSAFQQNPGIAPGLLRMAFHDCFVQGCDASVLLDGPKSEKAAGPNFSLRGFEVIDAAKQQLEQTCPGVVSCADILAFAARDSVVQTGGPQWDVPAGRLDGRVSSSSEAASALPGPTFSVSQLTQAFAAKGLSESDMITLSGAHTIGQTHCSSITGRLYPTVDPTLDATLAQSLISQCPQSGGDSNTLVNLDPTTPNTFDNQYYSNLFNSKGVLGSDQLLFNDMSTKASATFNSFVGNAWESSFQTAMVALSSIEVKTGSDGEIRRNCRVVNS